MGKSILEKMGFGGPVAEAMTEFRKKLEEDKKKYLRCCG